VVFLICFKTKRANSQVSIFSLKQQGTSKLWFDIAGVSDITNDLVTNHVSM